MSRTAEGSQSCCQQNYSGRPHHVHQRGGWSRSCLAEWGGKPWRWFIFITHVQDVVARTHVQYLSQRTLEGLFDTDSGLLGIASKVTLNEVCSVWREQPRTTSPKPPKKKPSNKLPSRPRGSSKSPLRRRVAPREPNEKLKNATERQPQQPILSESKPEDHTGLSPDNRLSLRSFLKESSDRNTASPAPNDPQPNVQSSVDPVSNEDSDECVNVMDFLRGYSSRSHSTSATRPAKEQEASRSTGSIQLGECKAQRLSPTSTDNRPTSSSSPPARPVQPPNCERTELFKESTVSEQNCKDSPRNKPQTSQTASRMDEDLKKTLSDLCSPKEGRSVHYTKSQSSIPEVDLTEVFTVDLTSIFQASESQNRWVDDRILQRKQADQKRRNSNRRSRSLSSISDQLSYIPPADS